MTTRLYSGSTTAPDVSPAFGAYDRTANAVRLQADTVKLGEAFATLIQNADGASNTPPFTMLYTQLVTFPLAAQTLLGSGTFKGVFRAACSNADFAAGGNDGIAFRLAKCDEDGTNRTEILTYKVSTTPALATASALTNQQLKDGVTNPVSIGGDVTINEGDRLIIEIALQERTTNTGRTGRIEYGDAHASDLVDNNTGTSQFAPWVEFSQDLVFASGTIDLVVQDASHGHSAENVALTQEHQLVVADALHAHSAENVVLTQLHQLVVADALHAHAADNVALTQAHVLVVSDAGHVHVADNLDLTQDHILVVSDALHTHLADTVALALDVPTPVARIYVIETEDRCFVVVRDRRVLAIESEDRTYPIQ